MFLFVFVVCVGVRKSEVSEIIVCRWNRTDFYIFRSLTALKNDKETSTGCKCASSVWCCLTLTNQADSYWLFVDHSKISESCHSEQIHPCHFIPQWCFHLLCTPVIEDEGGNNFLEQSSEIICLVGVCGLVRLFSLALGSLLKGCLTGNEFGSSVPLHRNIVTLENDCMEILMQLLWCKPNHYEYFNYSYGNSILVSFFYSSCLSLCLVLFVYVVYLYAVKFH